MTFWVVCFFFSQVNLRKVVIEGDSKIYSNAINKTLKAECRDLPLWKFRQNKFDTQKRSIFSNAL